MSEYTEEDESMILSDFAAYIIKRSLEETQLEIALQGLDEIGMRDDFIKFLNEKQPLDIWQGMKDFAALHPDKFYVPCPMEPYGKFIIIENEKRPLN